MNCARQYFYFRGRGLKVMNNDTITEWQILFSLGSGKEDFYTEDELEYEEYFEET